MSTPLDAFAPQPRYQRFSKSDRIQHIVMLASFLVLTVTGLPQKFICLNNRYLDAADRRDGRHRDGPHRPPLRRHRR